MIVNRNVVLHDSNGILGQDAPQTQRTEALNNHRQTKGGNCANAIEFPITVGPVSSVQPSAVLFRAG